MKKCIIFFTACLFVLVGCSHKLLPPQSTVSRSLLDYKYFYVAPTTEIRSEISGTYGSQYGIYGSSQTKTIIPSEEISGHLLKLGLIRLPKVPDYNMGNTLIVNFGVSGRRNVSISGYTTIITLQFVDAKTMEVIAIGTAEGIGSTESDDIRIAIQRCMDDIAYKSVNVR